MENSSFDGPRSVMTSYFRSGGAIRSRSIGTVVPAGMVHVAAPPPRVAADWAREISTRMALEPGDVDPMPLARTQMRWPDYSLCVRAMQGWVAAQGMAGVLDDAEVALMACRGADYHHDGLQYGGAAFCNLFLSEDKGLDVHFPRLGLRIPLTRGTAILFDTCQPHAVITRGSGGFDEADFAPEHDNAQVFLSWELAIEDARVMRALGVQLDVDAAAASAMDEEQVRFDSPPNYGGQPG